MTDDKRPSANVLYNRANRDLRDRHPDEFRELLVGAYAQEGLTYKARRTAAEREAAALAAEKAKAASKVQALVDKYGTGVLPLRIDTSSGTGTFPN